MGMSRRLDGYLIRELFSSTLVGTALALVVLLGLQGLRLSDLIIRYDLGGSTIARMLVGLALSFTPIVLPIAFLFALLLVFGRMSSDREFVALQAMGRSPKRLLAPCLVFGTLVCGASLACSFWIGPKGNQQFEISIDEAFKKKVAAALRSGTFSEGFLDMVLFVDQIDPITQEMKRLFIHDEANYKEPASISASRGRWIESVGEGLGVLLLQDGVLISRNPDTGALHRMNFDEYRINADFSRQAGLARDSPPSLELNRLLAKRQEAKARPAEIDGRPVWVEIARRAGVSLACLLFVPLCFALSLDNRRTVKSRAVGLGLVILLLYWTAYFALVTWVLKTGAPWARQAEIWSWVVVWVPNFALMGAGWLAWRRSIARLF
jgi:lipopolysaccharide export system permease protein